LRSLLAIVSESQFVHPTDSVASFQFHEDHDVRELPSRKGTQLRNALAFANGLFESTADRDNIVEESKNVQEIRLSRGIGANDKHSLRKVDFDPAEITPVFQMQVRESKTRVFSATAAHRFTIKDQNVDVVLAMNASTACSSR